MKIEAKISISWPCSQTVVDTKTLAKHTRKLIKSPFDTKSYEKLDNSNIYIQKAPVEPVVSELGQFLSSTFKTKIARIM